jgi:hypothetical protein
VTRVPRDVALRLLGAAGTVVTMHEHELLEDVDGIPLGVDVQATSAMLCVRPELLGWTWAELGVDPEDDQ